MSDVSERLQTEWRYEDGAWIKYEHLTDQQLETIAIGLLLENKYFKLNLQRQQDFARFAVEKEIYRRLLKRIISENKLDGEQALLMTSKFPFLRSVFK